VTTPSASVQIAYAADGPIEARRATVAAQHPTAALAGIEIFAAGGNAMDAAVAAALGAAVGDVGRTGIGGYGGHITYHVAASGQTWVIDFSSRAPQEADPGRFARSGSVSPTDDPRQTGPLAVAPPAVVAGLAAAHARFGRLPWATLLEPAIKAAEAGIDFPDPGRQQVFEQHERVAAFPETVRVFMDAWQGQRLRQPDLGRTLRRLAEDGPRAMYEGDLARRIVGHVRSLGGVLREADLAEYQPSISPAPHVSYRGYDVFAPGDGSGGGVLLEVLGRLNGLDVPAMAALGLERVALLADTVGSVWRERLTTTPRDPGRHTDHLSVADSDGNVVACTTTLQLLLGSGVTVPGTGILLNSGMGLFDLQPGRPTSLESGKPAVTNMCPTIVMHGPRSRLAVGGSGGRLIPSMVAQVVTLVVDYGWPIDRALAAPRLHTIGDGRLTIEAGLDQSTLDGLAARGFTVQARPWASMDLGGQSPAVWFDDEGRLFGAPDPRRHGAATVL
jgi:gamma-glutamyltranspeptidase/glutathione hydrolase